MIFGDLSLDSSTDLIDLSLDRPVDRDRLVGHPWSTPLMCPLTTFIVGDPL